MTANFDLKEKFSKKKITENLGLKITSLIVAIVLWFIVVNITDPIVTQKYTNIHVKVLNSDTITNNGKTFEIIDNSAVVSSVVVKAPRTVIREIGNSSDNIVAVADLSNISKDGISVPIEFSTSKFGDKVESIRPSSSVLKVNIENKRTIQLPINATTSGDIESGYILGNVVPNQNQVRVSGPESVINRIKDAYVDVQVTGFTGDISTQADIMLFDGNGDGIPTTNLELNVDSVRVDVEILATKKVPVFYSTIGTPADGYGVTGETECNPEVVVIAGERNTIETVSEIKISAEELNVTGQSSDMMSVVDIKKYLPYGVRLADQNFNGKVAITIYIEQFKEVEYAVHPKSVKIENVPLGYGAEVQDSENAIEYTLIGLAQDLEKLNFALLDFRVDFEDYALMNDVSGFDEGVYMCNLLMNLPSGIRLQGSVQVPVKLKAIEQ